MNHEQKVTPLQPEPPELLMPTMPTLISVDLVRTPNNNFKARVKKWPF
jgi:hypothetical protein